MKRLLIPLMLVAVSLSAQPSGRLDSLRVRAYVSMNMQVTGTALVTSAVVNRIINQSIGTVCSDFVDALQKYDTVALTGSVEAGSLNTDCLEVLKVWRMLGDSIRVKLYPESVYTKSPGDTTGSKQNLLDASSPAYFRIVGQYISTFPKFMKPGGYVDSLLVQYQATDRQLRDDSMATAIAGNYIDALDWLILSNLYAYRSMTVDAAYWQGKYDRKKGVK